MKNPIRLLCDVFAGICAIVGLLAISSGYFSWDSVVAVSTDNSGQPMPIAYGKHGASQICFVIGAFILGLAVITTVVRISFLREPMRSKSDKFGKVP